jgi:quercetin dioxygenase-like cupin family protein
MPLYHWNEIPLEQLNPSLARQCIHTATMTVARIHLKKGAVVPAHAHANEQVTLLERGRVRFTVGGEPIVLEPGDIMHTPPEVPHGVEALEDSLALDLFSPPREDWRRGDDAYLR